MQSQWGLWVLCGFSVNNSQQSQYWGVLCWKCHSRAFAPKKLRGRGNWLQQQQQKKDISGGKNLLFPLVEWFYFLPHWKVKKFWNEDFKPRKMSLLLGKNWLGQTPIKKSTEDSRMPCERDWSSILFFEIREFQEWGILRMSCNCLDAPIPL